MNRFLPCTSVPPSVQRVKGQDTDCDAGQPYGSARQRQPVRRTDRLACTTTRRFPSRGRPQPAARRGRSTSGVRRAPCSAVSALG